MLRIWDAPHFRRTLAAVCLIAAPLCFAVAELLFPPDAEDPAAQLALWAQYHDRLVIATLFGALAYILFVPAFFGLIHLLTERGVVLGHLGGGLAVAGALLNLMLAGAQIVFSAMAAPGLERGAMVQLYSQLTGGQTPAAAPLVLGHYFFGIGIVLLALGVWRARVAPRWTAVCIILALVLDIGLGGALGDSLAISALTDAFLIAGFGGIAWTLLSESDEAWEQHVTMAGTHTNRQAMAH